MMTLTIRDGIVLQNVIMLDGTFFIVILGVVELSVVVLSVLAPSIFTIHSKLDCFIVVNNFVDCLETVFLKN